MTTIVLSLRGFFFTSTQLGAFFFYWQVVLQERNRSDVDGGILVRAPAWVVSTESRCDGDAMAATNVFQFNSRPGRKVGVFGTSLNAKVRVR